MGKPILGEHSRLEVMIEESCEFKVWSHLTQKEREKLTYFNGIWSGNDECDCLVIIIIALVQ